jgi:hypothetical protein
MTTFSPTDIVGNGYYPTGIYAARGGLAVQESVPGWGYGVGAGVRQPSP